MNEHRSKLSAEVVQEIERDIQELKDAISQNNPEKMKECTAKVRNGAMKIGQAIYSQQGAQQGGEQQQQQQQEDNQNQENK